MTVEELKLEAEKLGYRIVKNKPTVRLEPCPICGSKRTIEWIHTNSLWRYSRQCAKCDFRSDPGGTKREAREYWNKKVKETK